LFRKPFRRPHRPLPKRAYAASPPLVHGGTDISLLRRLVA
jgi:hypothetical protein